MQDLKSLVAARDKSNAEFTLKIFKQIGAALGCVTAYLTDIDNYVAQGIITWEDVSIMEGMLIVMGTVNYNVGDTIELGDEEIIMTEENVDEFQQIVHMTLPFELAEEGDEDKILEYLYKTADTNSLDDFSEIVMPPPAVLDEEFDLSELSDEQIQSLKLQTIKSRQ